MPRTSLRLWRRDKAPKEFFSHFLCNCCHSHLFHYKMFLNVVLTWMNRNNCSTLESPVLCLTFRNHASPSRKPIFLSIFSLIYCLHYELQYVIYWASLNMCTNNFTQRKMNEIKTKIMICGGKEEKKMWIKIRHRLFVEFDYLGRLITKDERMYTCLTESALLKCDLTNRRHLPQQILQRRKTISEFIIELYGCETFTIAPL